MQDAELIEVEVVYARPERQEVRRLRLKPGATAREALQRSELVKLFPELDCANLALGIHGRRVDAGQQLADGDRLEIYRPLSADPRQLRRQRSRRGLKL